MKKILIIGAKGNLGTALAEVYVDANPLLWDKDEIDITDEDQVIEKISAAQPEIVYNCAAYNAVDKAEEEGGVADMVNGYGPGNLARICDKIGAILVHFSSGYVFDGQKSEGYNEEDKTNPISAYGHSKRLGEVEVQQHAEKHYLVRTSMLYGPPTQGKKSFIDIMLDMAKEKKMINAVDDEFGQPTYVKDLAQALVFLTEEEKPFGTYHITNSGMASWYDWAREIFAVKGIKPNMAQIHSEGLKRAARRPKYGILNNTRFIELRPWTEALKEYLTK